MGQEQSENEGMSPNHENAEKVIADLQRCSPYLQELEQQLISGLRNIEELSHSGLDAQLLKRVRKLVPTIKQLSVFEYGRLVGTFNTLRKQHSEEPISKTILLLSKQVKGKHAKTFLHELKTIFDGAQEIIIGERGDRPTSASLISRFLGKSTGDEVNNSTNMTLAADALVLLRTVYPAGVNMLSPDWTGNYYCDAESVVEINKLAPRGKGSRETFVPRDILKVEPYGEGASMVTYEHIDRDVDSAFPIIIRDGESILIGRSLGIRGIFGVEHAQTAVLRVKIRGAIHDSSVSRAGLLVFRNENRVYVFNRGSMNNYQIVEENAALKSVTSFAGTCIESADGFYDFGSVQKTRVVPNQAHLQEVKTSESQNGIEHLLESISDDDIEDVDIHEAPSDEVQDTLAVRSTEFSSLSIDELGDSQVIYEDSVEAEEVTDESVEAVNTLVSPLLPDQYESVSDVEAEIIDTNSSDTSITEPPQSISEVPKSTAANLRNRMQSTDFHDDITMPGTQSLADVQRPDEKPETDSFETAAPEEITMPGTSRVTDIQDSFIIDDQDAKPLFKQRKKERRDKTEILKIDENLVESLRKDNQKQIEATPNKPPKRIRSDTLNAPLDELDSIRTAITEDAASQSVSEDKTVATSRQDLLGDALSDEVRNPATSHAGFTQAGLKRDESFFEEDEGEGEEDVSLDGKEKISIKFAGIVDQNDKE